MKKALQILGVMLLLLCCSEGDEFRKYSKPVKMTFTATSTGDKSGETKSELDGNDILWQTGDQISIFDGSANNPFTLSDGAGYTFGAFSGEAVETSTYLSLYPYQSTASMTSGKITASIPTNQTAVSGTYDPQAFLAAATTADNKNFMFRNAASLLKFTVGSGQSFTKATIRGLGGEDLSGEILITPSASSPYITIEDGTDASNEVNVEGTLTDASYYAAIRPQTFTSGISMVLEDADGQLFRQEWTDNAPYVAQRNHVYNLGTLNPAQIYLDGTFTGPGSIGINEDAIFALTASSLTLNNLHSLTLEYSNDNGTSWNAVGDATVTAGTFTPTFTADSGKDYDGTVTLNFSQPGSFKVRLTASEGTNSISMIHDIEILNSFTETYYQGTDVSPFSPNHTTWRNTVYADFNNGDYIEVALNIGPWHSQQEILFSISTKNVSLWDWTVPTIHMYKDGTDSGGAYSIWQGSPQANVHYHSYGTGVDTIRFDRNGLSVNGILVFDNTAAHVIVRDSLIARYPQSIEIGAVQGGKPSCATYEYIKVVHMNAVTVKVSSVTLPETASVIRGYTTTVTPTVLPANATDKTLTWSSNDTSVATVDPNTGVITGVAAGSCTITATSTDGSNKSGTCTLTVTEPVLVTSVTLPATATVNVGANLTLTGVTVLPADATNKTLTWSSSDTNVATVNASTGVITGVATGTCTITATSTDGSSVSGTCTLTVSGTPVSSVKLPSTESVFINDFAILRPVVAPYTATDKSVTWSSSDPTKATVDANGKVTPVATGTTVITATSVDNPSKSSSCTVTVVPAIGNITYLRGTGTQPWVSDGTQTLNNGNAIGPVAVDFANGDYIEVQIDLLDCSNDKNIFSFGDTPNSWDTSKYHFVITANNCNHSSNWYQLYFYALGNGTSSQGWANDVGQTPKIKISSSGIYVNGTMVSNYDTTLANSIISYLSNLYPGTFTIDNQHGNKLPSCSYDYIKIVRMPVNVSQVTLPSTLTVPLGGSTTLGATVLPSGASNKTVTWSSSDTSKATVNASTGEITGVAAGSTTIRATSQEDPTKYAECTVTVAANPSEVMLWQNFTTPNSVFSKNLTVITSGTPAPGEIDFTSGDYIEAKIKLPDTTTNGMVFHVGQTAASPYNWVPRIDVFAKENIPTWLNIVYRPSSGTAKLGFSHQANSFYVRFGYNGGVQYSQNGVNWTDNATLNTAWSDNVAALSTISLGSAMTGTDDLKTFPGVFYDYVKIVRGSN